MTHPHPPQQQRSQPRRSAPHSIVFANEKGGTGKSTTAVHVAVALAYQGARVAAIDLDPRQRTLYRYCENRAETIARRKIDLPQPRFGVFEGDSIEALEQQVAELSQDADFIVFDTPGRDDPFARHVATQADTLVTPMNDSFVDFDLIGQVDATSFKVKRLSFYAELIWEARMRRSRRQIEEERGEMDWVVVRNRTGHTDAKNQRRIERALAELSRRVGFRVSPGLSERVTYRELFPAGLTLLDKGQLGELGTSHLVARQELRALVANLNLPGLGRGTTQADRRAAGDAGTAPGQGGDEARSGGRGTGAIAGGTANAGNGTTAGSGKGDSGPGRIADPGPDASTGEHELPHIDRAV